MKIIERTRQMAPVIVVAAFAAASFTATPAYPDAPQMDPNSEWTFQESSDEMTDRREYVAILFAEEAGERENAIMSNAKQQLTIGCDGHGMRFIMVQFRAFDLGLEDGEHIQERFDREKASEAWWATGGSIRGRTGWRTRTFLNDLENHDRLILRKDSDTLHFNIQGAAPHVAKIRELCPNEGTFP